MRNSERLRLGFAVAAIALLAILVTAAPAGARIFSLGGGSTASRGCNADARVRFDVVIVHGDYRKVKDFQVKDYGFPNLTPPVPYGHPRGECIPGEEDWAQICVPTPMGPCAVPFGKGRHANDFVGVDRYPTTGPPTTWEGYLGAVHARKVGRPHHRHWKVTAHGLFAIALSEGGLQYGGSSTDAVDWKAHS